MGASSKQPGETSANTQRQQPGNPDVAPVLARQIAKFARRLKKALAAIDKDCSRRNTHFLSTSLRRLFAADWLVRELCDAKLLRKRKDGLEAVRKALSKVRDAQEMQGTFAELEQASPFAAAFAKHLRKEEARTLKAFKKAYARLVRDRIDALTKAARVRKQIGLPVGSVASLRRRLLERVFDLREPAILQDDDRALHKMRVRYKYFRYATELLAPEIVPLGKEDLAYFKTLQDAMGKAHDAAVLEDALQAFDPPTPLEGRRACLRAAVHHRQELHAYARDYVDHELARIAESVIGWEGISP